MVLNINESFDKLNEKIVAYFETRDESVLDDAKELFSSFVGSNRQLQRVQNIRQLLILLQRRELHSPFELLASQLVFQKIILDDDEFSQSFSTHQSLVASTARDESLENCYAAMRQRARCEGERDFERQNAIFTIIAERFSARDILRLGRALGFKERELKEIEERCTDCHSRTIVMLGLMKERKQSTRKLLLALELIGKMDIVRDLENI